MSSINTVNAIYTHIMRGRIPAMLDCLDPQIEWILAAGLPGGGTYRTRDAVQELFTGYANTWDDFRITPEEFFSSGHVVIVLGHYHGVNKQTGKTVDARFAHVWRMRQGLAERFETIADTHAIVQTLS